MLKYFVKAKQRMTTRGAKLFRRVVTTGGVYGTVTRVKPDHVEVEVADKVRLMVQRGAISALRREE